ncbi:MAG: hypothetical protein HOE19_02035 [Candidatus Komeilibacteria bacterium]|jgi:hypothetical protein|nr:hypothetical protein [Candidatus Komeilibacteria bacterium]MBT4447440.1 hypothetical protein [Candidatus Komeilibacteria bacterium]
MTSRQKTHLFSWVIFVVILSRALFFIPDLFPGLLPENIHNYPWVDFQIHLSSKVTPVVISHQFIDPLLLGLITWVIGRLLLLTPGKIYKTIFLVIFPACLVGVTYYTFYEIDGHHLIANVLKVGSYSGNALKCFVGGISVAIVFALAGIILGLLILGSMKFHELRSKKPPKEREEPLEVSSS